MLQTGYLGDETVPVNARTSEVLVRHMSGNSTDQELAELCAFLCQPPWNAGETLVAQRILE
jgi:hypothetical protein